MHKNIIILLLFPLLAWGCAAKLPQDYERLDSRAYSDTRDTPLVFDREIVFIGSLNMDPRSVIHNTEIGVLFSAEDLGRDMGETFDRIAGENAFSLKLVKNKNGTDRIVWHGVKDGEPVTFDTEPYTGFWKRLGVGLMGLLPIESQL